MPSGYTTGGTPSEQAPKKPKGGKSRDAGDKDVPLTERPRDDKGKPNIKYWVSQLTAAAKASKPARDATTDAWREYLHDFETSEKKNTEPRTRYPIYWASIKTMQPAIYSRTPVPAIEKVFDDLEDDIARLSSLCLERLAKYLIKATPFDRVAYATRDDFLHAGKTTNRVCFESEISSEPVKTRYMPQEVTDPVSGQTVVAYYDEQGEPAPDGTALLQDAEGFYSEGSYEQVESVAIELIPVHYADVLHSPAARHHEEIDWIAYKCLLTRADVRERFGKDWADKLATYFTSIARKENKKDSELLPDLYVTIWEIWNKRDRSVLWYCERFNDEFVDTQDDPYELSGFFPSPPFMLGTIGPDSLYAVPDYVQLKPLILQLHGMAERFRKLVRATRRRGLFDKTIPELTELTTDADEGEFIGVGNYQQLVRDKGGLDAVVQFFPVEPLVSAIQEMAQVVSMYEARFNEIYGIPDILRGTSDPTETAAAQQLKGKYTSLRFSAIQREFQRVVRDDVELMCDLALKKFPEDKLSSVMGVPRMDPDDQALWPQALELLRNDSERKVRITIETDSTITMNEAAEIEQRNYLARSLFEGLKAVSALAETAPQMIPVALETILYVVRGLREGGEIEKSLESAIEQMVQQGPPQPPGPPPEPPPPPDYTPQQLQLDAQKLQVNSQLEQQKLFIAQGELQLKAQQMQIDMAQVQGSQQTEQGKLALDNQIAQFDAYLKQLEHQLESYKVSLDEREKYATEARLQQEFEERQLDRIDAGNERAKEKVAAKATEKGNGAEKGSGPALHLHLGADNSTTIAGL